MVLQRRRRPFLLRPSIWRAFLVVFGITWFLETAGKTMAVGVCVQLIRRDLVGLGEFVDVGAFWNGFCVFRDSLAAFSGIYVGF